MICFIQRFLLIFTSWLPGAFLIALFAYPLVASEFSAMRHSPVPTAFVAGFIASYMLAFSVFTIRRGEETKNFLYRWYVALSLMLFATVFLLASLNQ